MRLPRSNYSNAPVPSMGRHDINAPLRVAAAQSRAAQAKFNTEVKKHAVGSQYFDGLRKVEETRHRTSQRLSNMQFRMDAADRQHNSNVNRAILGLVNTGIQAYSQHQAEVDRLALASDKAEASGIVTRYKQAAGNLRNELESDQFRVDESGMIRPNSDRVMDGYYNGSDSLKDIHLEEITNDRVKEMVMAEIGKIDMDNEMAIGKTVIKWNDQYAQIQTEESLDQALAAGDIPLAKRIFLDGVDTGGIDHTKVASISGKIRVAESTAAFDTALGAVESPVDMAALRDSVDTPMYGHLSDTQKNQLTKLANTKIKDYWLGSIKDVTSIGVKTAKDTLRELSQMSAAEMGLESESAHKKLIGEMKTVIGNAEFGVKKVKSAADNIIRTQELDLGAFVNPADSGEMKNYNKYFNTKLDVIEKKTGQRPAPFSQEWNMAVVQSLNGRSVFPPDVKNALKGHASHHDPAVVVKAAQFYGQAREANPVGVEGMKLGTKVEAFYSEVNTLSSAGMPPEDAVKSIRDSIYSNDPRTMESRSDSLKTIIDEDFDDMIEDKIDDTDGYWESSFGFNLGFGSNIGMTEEAKGKLESLFTRHYMDTGSVEGAMNKAWSQFISTHAPSERTGTVVGPDSPEVMYNGVLPPEAIHDELKSVLNDLELYDVQVGDVTLTPSGLGPKNEPVWAMYVESADLDRRGYIRSENGELLRISFNPADTKYGQKAIQEINDKRQEMQSYVDQRQNIYKSMVEEEDEFFGPDDAIKQLDQGHMFLSPERLKEKMDQYMQR